MVKILANSMVALTPMILMMIVITVMMKGIAIGNDGKENAIIEKE